MKYINAVAAASQRVADMTAQIEAAILLAELGDISRFDSPRQLASFVGLVPGEHSSGRRRRQRLSPRGQTIAWKAQKHLCGRYYKLMLAGKTTRQTTVAIARELMGFVWDIVRTEMEKLTIRAA